MLYKENVRVKKKWGYVLLIMALITFVFSITIHSAFQMFSILSFIFSVLCLFLDLEVKVYDDRITYRLKPLGRIKSFKFNELRSLEVIQYNNKGVYGFKIKKNHKGALYFIGSSDMIHIQTSGYEHIYLSTNKKDELKVLFDQVSNN
jgi:hypothetical protein